MPYSPQRSLDRLRAFSVFALFLMLILGLVRPASAQNLQELDWLDLLPDTDRQEMENMPELSHEGSGPPSNLPAVLQSAKVRQELDQRKIRIAGYIVPVEFDDNWTVTEFFLVPYFGACIHVPPPPPNQIIHVIYKKGVQLQSITEPYWIAGTLRTLATSNDIASSAYSLAADLIEPYQY